MKRIAKGYYAAAGLLILWAATDLYHYAAVGRDLLLAYDGVGAVQRLVWDVRFQGAVKLLLGALVLLVGWLRRRRGEKRPRSLTAVSLRLGAGILGLWLFCSAALTLGTAQFLLDELSNRGLDLAENAYQNGTFPWLYEEDYYSEDRRVIPGIVEWSMNQAIANTGVRLSAPTYDSYSQLEESAPPSVYRDSWVSCETAVLFLDSQGEAVRESGDFIYFSYVTQEDWQAGEETTAGYGWVDLGEEDDPRYQLFRNIYSGTNSLYDCAALRMTGYFDGSRFEPSTLALLTTTEVYQALDTLSPSEESAEEEGTPEEAAQPNMEKSATTSGSGGGDDYGPAYTYSGLDAMGLLEWDVRFENGAAIPDGVEPVTIYAARPDMTLYEAEGPVR